MATPTTLPSSFTAGQVLTAAQMNDLRGAFRILQIVSTTRTDTFSASVASAAVSGAAISTSITPTSATSKVLIIAQLSPESSTEGVDAVLYRDGSILSGAVGDSAGNRRQGTAGSLFTSGRNGRIFPTVPILFLDSPATTSATTYDCRLGHTSTSTQTVYLNRSNLDPDVNETSRLISTLTVMEVSA